MDRAGTLKTVTDLMNVAREFAQDLDDVKKANRELVSWVASNPQEVPLELQERIIKLSNAISKF